MVAFLRGRQYARNVVRKKLNTVFESKAMAMKNYTSEVPISSSMARIEKNLVIAGAKKIMRDYDADGNCISISFQIVTDRETLGFQLPSRVEAIYKKLYSKYTRPTTKSEEIVRAQAGRTAWKIISDWVEIQITMIELEQAELAQVFLPYLFDGKQTFYDKFKKDGFKALR